MLKLQGTPFVVPKKKEMPVEKIRPIYKNILIAAIALYIIGTTFALSDIYYKVINIEHSLVHKAPLCQHGVKTAK